MADLFISYAKPDRSLATELADELRERGFSVWIDQGGIGGAKNWTAEIVEAINSCSTLLVLLSPDSVSSHNVAKELQLASEKRKNILPVVIEKVTLPSVFEYPLVGLQRVYYHDRPAIFNALELLTVTLRGADVPSAVGQPSPSDRAVRVAVLPFDDLSPKHDNQWFADGMMDELITTLRGLEHVKVPSRSDVLHYREHHKKSRVVANELGVRYIIEGGVRKAGERIRINASLVDADKSEQLWASSFDGNFDDVFDFQESVSKKITEALKLQLSPQEEEQIETRPTENAEAYELYLKGRHEQYYLTKESYERALDLYEQAASLDPKFDRAYIGIASVCCVYFREYSKDPAWIRRAEKNAAKAESVSGETFRSLYIRGMIEWLQGNIQTAITLLTRSTEMDPKNYIAFNVIGAINQQIGNYDAAAKAFRRVTEQIETTIGYFNLLGALAELEEPNDLQEIAEKALPVFDKHIAREPLDQNVIVSRGYVLLWAGRTNEAMLTANTLLERNDLGANSLYNLGRLFDKLGKPDLFVVLLKKAIEHGYRETDQAFNSVEDESIRDEYEKVIQGLKEILEKEKG